MTQVRTDDPSLALSELYQPIVGDLSVVEHIFDEEIRSALPFVNDLCGTVRSYRGKMLRPALLLLAGKAAGTMSPELHTLAAVVEMVHMATLVHDDILDEATERRKNPTICALAGNEAAVLLGDYLISHAYHLCSSLDSQYAARRVAATTNTVCEGELLQNYRRGADLSEADYLEIIRRKTASLTSLCCELGATYSGAPDASVSALRAYGTSLGMAFQVVDDVLDVVGERAKVGKTLGRDFDLGKLTMPTIHCLAHADEETVGQIMSIVSVESTRSNGKLLRWLEATDSIHYSRTVAERFADEAVQALGPLPTSDAKTSLIALAEFTVSRPL